MGKDGDGVLGSAEREGEGGGGTREVGGRYTGVGEGDQWGDEGGEV